MQPRLESILATGSPDFSSAHLLVASGGGLTGSTGVHCFDLRDLSPTIHSVDSSDTPLRLVKTAEDAFAVTFRSVLKVSFGTCDEDGSLSLVRETKTWRNDPKADAYYHDRGAWGLENLKSGSVSDSHRVVSGAPYRMIVWDPETAKEHGRLTGIPPPRVIRHVPEWSEAEVFVSGYGREDAGDGYKIRLCDLTKMVVLSKCIGHTAQVDDLAADVATRSLCSVSQDRTLRVLDHRQPDALVATHNLGSESARSCHMSADPHLLFLGLNKGFIEERDPRKLGTLVIRRFLAHGDYVCGGIKRVTRDRFVSVSSNRIALWTVKGKVLKKQSFSGSSFGSCTFGTPYDRIIERSNADDDEEERIQFLLATPFVVSPISLFLPSPSRLSVFCE